jgi:hypothetical protein
MAKKVQSQLLVSEVTRDRADAVALVRGEPRAEVYRLALEGDGLSGLEKTHRAELDIMAEVAARMGFTRLELARRAVQDGYTWEELRTRRTYPRRRVSA